MAGSHVCEVQVDDSLFRQSDNDLVDRISHLPSEVLVDILSLLTLKEVGRTSVLSKTWRDLWKLTPRLNFDASEVRFKLACMLPQVRRRELGTERSKLVTWVNEVVRLHECPFIEEFRVVFDLEASCGKDIDEWLKFMVRKRARRIELDMFACDKVEVYSPSQDCCNYIKSVSNRTNLVNLRSLCLKHVGVNRELLEYMLSNCPALETLSVKSSQKLFSLKVVGISVSLKYLRICRCEAFRSIELCAPKLERFIYFGPKVKFVIGRNPRLTELDIGGSYRQEVLYAFVPFRSLLSQLETLSDCALELCELSNVKHLTIELELGYDRWLTGFTKFIVAAPSLTKFTLMFDPVFPALRRISPLPFALEPHACLKEVEIFGFRGGRGDFEMATYLVRNAINLEKMVIDPMHPNEIMMIHPKELQKRLSGIREDVKVLKKGLPSSCELIVVGM